MDIFNELGTIERSIGAQNVKILGVFCLGIVGYLRLSHRINQAKASEKCGFMGDFVSDGDDKTS